MEFKDYYETLGVGRDASQKEIQDAYRKLARKYHPDVAKQAGAEDRFKEIGEAYDVLKDPEKRKKYDRFGSAWKQAQQRSGGTPPGWENVRVEYGPGFEQDFGFGGGGTDAEAFSSLFEELFGGAGGPFGGASGRRGGGDPFAAFRGGAGGRRAQQRARRGQDVESEIELSLEEAARGGKQTLTLQDPSTGQRQTFEVNIPAGIQPGKKLRLSGKGVEGFGGGPAGDLLLRVKVRPHPRFRLDGRNLHTEVKVTPWEAALGGEVEVPTLNGHQRVKIPAGTSSGRRIRLRGKGFPAAGQAGAGKKKGEAGDLFAEISVAVPGELSDEERELFERLADVSTFRPRS